MREEFQKIIGSFRYIMVKCTAVQKSHSVKVLQALYTILCHPFVHLFDYIFSFFFFLKLSELSYNVSTTAL